MCRSIKTLRKLDHPVTEAEIEAAALQYVRKISGYRAPSRANRAAFEHAVAQVAAVTRELLGQLAERGTEGQASETIRSVNG
jgi:hypothetical protein